MEYKKGCASRYNRNKSLKGNNLSELDTSIKLGISFLARFQKYTHVKDISAIDYLIETIESYAKVLKAKEKMNNNIYLYIEKLKEKVKKLKDTTVPLCGVHGDYDFYTNILFHDNSVSVVDFEHFEQEGLPFLDLATLIFNPILMNYEIESDLSFSSLLDKYDLRQYITKWMRLYSEMSGISMDILRVGVSIAALEQQTKDYGEYRDPTTFPLYQRSNFLELLLFYTGDEK